MGCFQSCFDCGMMRRQNKHRSNHGAGSLSWDCCGARHAQSHASKLARKNQTGHSGNRKYGENIYYFQSTTNRKPEASAVVDAWYNEVKQYRFGGNQAQQGTGHFTQSVWKGTRSCGFGSARGKNGRWVVVANYYPPGNVQGQFQKNVQPKKR